MHRTAKAIIELVEAAYDIQSEDEDWLPQIVERANALIGDGLGTLGVYGRHPHPGALPEVVGVSGPNELLMMQARLLQDLPKNTVEEGTETGVAAVMQKYRDRPKHIEVFQRHFRSLGAEDALSVTGIDPHGLGIHLFTLKAAVTELGPQQKLRWKMLTAHLSAGYRLRTALARMAQAAKQDSGALPNGAEAVIDPKTFRVEDIAASDSAKASVDVLRDAATRVDKVRGNQNRDDVLESWEALVRGRWSLVDWFDTDERRYVLAVPNAPKVANPRGLTERESQVAAYAAIGESHKLIGYRLGISRGRVTNYLKSIMDKLDVQTQAQLVGRLRGLTLASAAKERDEGSEPE